MNPPSEQPRIAAHHNQDALGSLIMITIALMRILAQVAQNENDETRLASSLPGLQDRYFRTDITGQALVSGPVSHRREGKRMAVPGVRVETVELDATGTRQISSRRHTTALLQERRADIEAAVREACDIIQDSAAKVNTQDGWHVRNIEATFGLTLAAEAGVILSKASAEASFEVKVTIERA
jgi:hypothetical protein